ncbi:mechanosensitive ion channel domain-containing protein [uncultured Roseibium sp.]|uniref:mechanosensitive ion channel family protein n=1 Tax=uncultured Roseibium sp. TaxID=1936171 RepID=UPI00260A5DDE|nr:mechanosensitive ion channel domain-containing protein [uncultured Roseibium sp.]
MPSTSLFDGPCRLAARKSACYVATGLALHSPWRARWLCLITLCIGILFSETAFPQEKPPETWYEVEALANDLTEEQRQALATPRGLVETFLRLSEEQRLEEAAMCLNLSEFPGQLNASEPARLARMFAGVLQRRVVIDWAALPDRPDGVNTALPTNHPFSGQPRRTLKIAELSAEGRPITISISRYKPEGAEAVWLFSKQTVSRIAEMHALYRPGLLDRYIPQSLNIEVIGPVRLWELFLVPLLIVLFVAMVMVLRAVIGALARYLPVRFIQRASRKIRTPLAIALTALAVENLLETFLSFSGPINSLLAPVLLFTLIFCLTLAVLRTIDTSLDLATERYVGDLDSEADSDRRHLYTNIYAARRYVLLVAVVVTLVLFLMQLNLFDSFGMSLLASAGVATVILGIAGQTVLGNLLASLQIAIAKPIRIGDAVLYEGKWCYVEAIYYTFITLRSWDSRRLIVPVKYFISQPFENWTMTDAKSTRSFSMELDLCADPAALRDVFERLVKDEEHYMPDELLLVTVEEYGQSTQKVMFYATADSPSEAWMMNVRLSEKMGNWVRENRPEWWPRLRLADVGVTSRGMRDEVPAKRAG